MLLPQDLMLWLEEARPFQKILWVSLTHKIALLTSSQLQNALIPLHFLGRNNFMNMCWRHSPALCIYLKIYTQRHWIPSCCYLITELTLWLGDWKINQNTHSKLSLKFACTLHQEHGPNYDGIAHITSLKRICMGKCKHRWLVLLWMHTVGP